MSIKHFLARLASVLTANQFSQRCLASGIRVADHLMGVGSGSAVAISGEASVLRRLRGLHQAHELVVFDVGANKGQFLQMTLEETAGAPIRVHCFEPSKSAYAMLAKRADGLKNVTLNNIGLGREPGERLLFMDKPGSGLASLTKRRLDHFGVAFSGSETVTLATLDNYCSLHGITHIDLLKIDVEGHELEVLAGGAGMLRNQSVRFVSFEFGGCNIDTRTFVQDFYYLFAEYDMRLARITPGGFWLQVDQYQEVYEQFRTTNFVAYRAPVN